MCCSISPLSNNRAALRFAINFSGLTAVDGTSATAFPLLLLLLLLDELFAGSPRFADMPKCVLVLWRAPPPRKRNSQMNAADTQSLLYVKVFNGRNNIRRLALSPNSNFAAMCQARQFVCIVPTSFVTQELSVALGRTVNCFRYDSVVYVNVCALLTNVEHVRSRRLADWEFLSTTTRRLLDGMLSCRST
jgi:hypothetical protein